MRGIEEMLNQMKNIDRSNNAKEETLRKLQKSRKRKSRPFFPVVITGIVIVALFYIMTNMTNEMTPERAQGIALEKIEKSSLMRSVSIEEFNPELVNHVGVVDIYDNEEWESTVRRVLQTMNETEILPEDMSLYDLGVSSDGQRYRFKIWRLDEKILVQDFDSGVNYLGSGEDVESFLKMANEFIEDLINESQLEPVDTNTIVFSQEGGKYYLNEVTLGDSKSEVFEKLGQNYKDVLDLEGSGADSILHYDNLRVYLFEDKVFLLNALKMNENDYKKIFSAYEGDKYIDQQGIEDTYSGIRFFYREDTSHLLMAKYEPDNNLYMYLRYTDSIFESETLQSPHLERIAGIKESEEEEEKEKDVEENETSLGFTKDEFKERFNTLIAERLKIQIGEVYENTEKNEVQFKFLINIEEEVDWEVVELTALKSPKTNELTQLKFSEKNPGVKERGHDRLPWYQFAVSMKEIFNFNRSEDEFIQMTGMFVDDRSVDYDVAISSPEVVFYVKLEGDELSMVIEPVIP
ncbi:hypothetical protein [Sporosarcina sp. FA9]|uniref:hypothetical protein n=1 Tax=Sporosarcina sp. FA9 TaxID=3413030 RepID=UPI003F65C27F